MATEVVSIPLEDREAHKEMGNQVKENKAKFLYYANDKSYYEVTKKV